MAIEQPKTMYVGQTKTFKLTFTKKSDGERLNLDTELAAGTDAIELQVKVLEGDADPALIAMDLASGIVKRTQAGDDLGVADATIPSSATTGGSWPAAPANVGIFRYDVKIILLSGAVDYSVIPSDLVVKAVVNGA